MENLFDQLFVLPSKEIDEPNFNNKDKVHDWKNYVPEDWIKNWEKFSYKEKQIIYILTQERADAEEWD